MFVFSELDHIAAVRKPDITPLGAVAFKPGKWGWGRRVRSITAKP